jgi:hypothetical protein
VDERVDEEGWIGWREEIKRGIRDSVAKEWTSGWGEGR